ncbi:MAG: glycosyl transferase group 1 [Chloroflexi bacterium]|nr:glycosyl transferase group 1 [Chloroflexota bacterium]
MITARTELSRDEGPTGVHTLTGWGTGAIREIADVVRRIEPDILHLQYQTGAFGMSPVINGLPLLLRTAGVRTPFVTTFHDMRAPYLLPKAGVLRSSAVHLLMGSSRASIFTDPDDLERAHPRRLCAWVPIAPNVRPTGAPNRAKARRRLGLATGDSVIAFYGFLNSSKGVDTLLRAAARLICTDVQLRLMFVGEASGASDPTNDDTGRRADRLAESLGLVDRIVTTGPLPHAKLSEALSAADLAVLPYTDGASLRRGSLLTCFAHGLPVVTTRPRQAATLRSEALVAPFWEPTSLQIDDSVASLVPAGDDAAVARAIFRLLNDPSAARALGSRAQAFVEPLQWPSVAEATIEVYRRVLFA